MCKVKAIYHHYIYIYIYIETRFIPNISRRPELGKALEPKLRCLSEWKEGDDALPIVYNEIYNMGFLGLENLHPFDSKKYKKVVKNLTMQSPVLFRREQLVAPKEFPADRLSLLHDAQYLHELSTSSKKVAIVTELAPLALLPSSLVNNKVLLPMRYMISGTVVASALALMKGWAINIGGGMHHAYYEDGGGWCPYTDIYASIHWLREVTDSAIGRFMVIDLDVHQGNGVERDKLRLNDEKTIVVDVYNEDIFPNDNVAKRGIDVARPLHSGCTDEVYIDAVMSALAEAFEREPTPDLVLYNAGTDILQGDPLGLLNVSEDAVVHRDQLVFEKCQQKKVPLVMLLSGGYTRASTPCITRSIRNVFKVFNLS